MGEAKGDKTQTFQRQQLKTVTIFKLRSGHKKGNSSESSEASAGLNTQCQIKHCITSINRIGSGIFGIPANLGKAKLSTAWHNFSR